MNLLKPQILIKSNLSLNVFFWSNAVITERDEEANNSNKTDVDDDDSVEATIVIAPS